MLRLPPKHYEKSSIRPVSVLPQTADLGLNGPQGAVSAPCAIRQSQPQGLLSARTSNSGMGLLFLLFSDLLIWKQLSGAVTAPRPSTLTGANCCGQDRRLGAVPPVQQVSTGT